MLDMSMETPSVNSLEILQASFFLTITLTNPQQFHFQFTWADLLIIALSFKIPLLNSSAVPNENIWFSKKVVRELSVAMAETIHKESLRPDILSNSSNSPKNSFCFQKFLQRILPVFFFCFCRIPFRNFSLQGFLYTTPFRNCIRNFNKNSSRGISYSLVKFSKQFSKIYRRIS